MAATSDVDHPKQARSPLRAGDERLKETPLAIRVMRRPELGAAAGLLFVTLFFLLHRRPVHVHARRA